MPLFDSIESQPRVPSLGTMVKLLSDALANRMDLAGLELDETKAQAGIFALLLGIIACLVNFAGFAFTFMIAALVWDGAHRTAWLAGLGGAYLLAAVIASFVLWRRIRDWRPFAETKSQLKQDRQCLSELTKSILR